MAIQTYDAGIFSMRQHTVRVHVIFDRFKIKLYSMCISTARR